ncbi:MAG: flagellar protein FliT [Gammaproteobacteria bacterium]|nr:flagellar protein FliT [Gammaproteobacteria bacterium]
MQNAAKKSLTGLDQLLNQSQRILELATQKDWQTVAEKESIRDALAQQVFANGFKPQSMADVETLRQVIALNDEVIRRAQAARQQVAAAAKKLRSNKKATDAYKHLSLV